MVVGQKDGPILTKGILSDGPHSCNVMEMDECGASENLEGSDKPLNLEKGEASDVVFSREAPLQKKDGEIHEKCSCSSKKLEPCSSALSDNSEVCKMEKLKDGEERKLSRQDRIELGRQFQGAVSSHNWELAESLILMADPQTLNDALCTALDSIWFLTTHRQLNGITGLIKKIVANGAHDFTRAILRTSFLASCVSTCQSRTMSLPDTITVMAQR